MFGNNDRKKWELKVKLLNDFIDATIAESGKFKFSNGWGKPGEYTRLEAADAWGNLTQMGYGDRKTGLRKIHNVSQKYQGARVYDLHVDPKQPRVWREADFSHTESSYTYRLTNLYVTDETAKAEPLKVRLNSRNVIPLAYAMGGDDLTAKFMFPLPRGKHYFERKSDPEYGPQICKDADAIIYAVSKDFARFAAMNGWSNSTGHEWEQRIEEIRQQIFGKGVKNGIIAPDIKLAA